MYVNIERFYETCSDENSSLINQSPNFKPKKTEHLIPNIQY